MSRLNQIKQHFLHDSLYRNSVYLMGSTFVIALFGFLYWVLAAHLYSTKFVGLAATLVAISNVVMILSVLGYDNAFIRFLPKAKNQSEQLDTGFTISSLVTIIVSVIYLVSIHLFVPKLSFVDGSLIWMLFFVSFMVINMLNFLNNYPFIAHRITHVVLVINVGMGILRLILLLALKPLGFNGLVLSQVLALGAAMLVTFYAMWRFMGYRYHPRIDWEEFRRTRRYTFNSYVSVVFLTLPAFILPTLVVNRLGSSSSAYYYIVAVIIAALNVIPMATSQSLFAEGVWDKEKLSHQLRKATGVVFMLTVPAVLVLAVAGKLILGIFGSAYAQSGYELLLLLALSGIPKALSYLLSAIMRIEHQVGRVALIYLIYAVIILVVSYMGIRQGHGLTSIGWATLTAEIVTALLYVLAYVNSPRARPTKPLPASEIRSII